jgi:hypothetical protein
MLEEIDAALHQAKGRARQQEELSRQRADFVSRLDSTRAQIAELQGRLSPEGNEDGVPVDPATINGMLHTLQSRVSEVGGQLRHLERQLAAFEGAQQEFGAALTRKEEALRGSGDPRVPELIEIARRYGEIETSLRGHEAAYQSGAEARRWVNAMRSDLELARKHSNRDIRGGLAPDILTNISKIRRTREADEAANRAKKELATFARRLADIGVNADPKLAGISVSWVGDVIFDNFLSDAVAHKNIVMTGAQADDMARWLTRMLDWLRERQHGLAAERTELLTRREALLLDEAVPADGRVVGGPGRAAGTAWAAATASPAGTVPGAGAPGALPDEIDHGVRAASERVRRYDLMSRRHAGLTPRLESVVSRLSELKGRLGPLESRVGQVKTASFTGLLATLSAGGRSGSVRERVELETLRLMTTALRERKQQLLDDLQAVQRERDELEPARAEHQDARTRQAGALRGHARAGELAELTQSFGEVEADLRGFEEAGRAAEETAEALADLRRTLGSAAAPAPAGQPAQPERDTPGALGGLRGLAARGGPGGQGGPSGHAGPGPDGYAGPGGHGEPHGPGALGDLHDADQAAWRAQRALDVLGGWLAGIGIDAQHALPETRRFAEGLLDNIINELTQHRRIVAAAGPVEELERWASQTAEWLRGRRRELEEHRAALHERCTRP